MIKLKKLYNNDPFGLFILLLFTGLFILELFNMDFILKTAAEAFRSSIFDGSLVILTAAIFPIGLSLLIYNLIYK